MAAESGTMIDNDVGKRTADEANLSPSHQPTRRTLPIGVAERNVAVENLPASSSASNPAQEQGVPQLTTRIKHRRL